MMRRKSEMLLFACLAAVIGLTGCNEWESSGDDDSWNDSYNWLDVSGVYMDVDGGVLVRAGTGLSSDSDTTDGVANTVTDEAVTSGAAVSSGIVSAAPILPGTLLIVVSEAGVFSGTLVDDNNNGVEDAGDTDGQLESPTLPDFTGTITYETGAWSISSPNLDGVSDVTISITYQQAETGGSSTAYSEVGDPIYTFNVLQTGNRVRIIDSNGNEFEGQLYDVNSTAGNLTDIPVGGDTDPAVGDFVASFYAEGTANGVFVTLDGSFAGSIYENQTPGTTTRANTLFDRRISGSWRESSGAAGVFLGATDPVTTTGTP